MGSKDDTVLKFPVKLNAFKKASSCTSLYGTFVICRYRDTLCVAEVEGCTFSNVQSTYSDSMLSNCYMLSPPTMTWTNCVEVPEREGPVAADGGHTALRAGLCGAQSQGVRDTGILV